MSQTTLSRFLNHNRQKTVTKEEQQHNCIKHLHIYVVELFYCLDMGYNLISKFILPCDSSFTLVLYLKSSLLMPKVYTVNPPLAINDSLISIFLIFKLSEQFPTTLWTSDLYTPPGCQLYLYLMFRDNAMRMACNGMYSEKTNCSFNLQK